MTSDSLYITHAYPGELWEPARWDDAGPLEANPPGWFWQDEDGEWFGPFETEERAREDAREEVDA